MTDFARVRRQTGQLGEAAAAAYLERAGAAILHRNYRCGQGEIDLVADDGGELVFVEVRARSSHSFGAPEESLTGTKRRRMVACALCYLQERSVEARSWRVDFIAVSVQRGRVTRLEHFKHAIQ